MPPRLEKLWSAIQSSLWFRPVLFVGWGVVLGLALPAVDRRWPGLGEAARTHWLSDYVPGTPTSSRDVLIALVTALVTVVAVTASMTMVTVQLASTQYTPRLLRRYLADVETQRVLGVYLLTVVYLLLVLGMVSAWTEEGDTGLPPVLSLGTALVLTVTCLLLLPHYLHHTARSVEASVIIASIGKQLIRELGRMEFEPAEEVGERRPGPDEEPTVVEAEETGYLQLVDEPRLLAALPPGVRTVRLDARTGDFLFPGLPLLSLWPKVALSERRRARLHGAFAVGRMRTPQQDVLFGVRQLVDMALRALSPAINDVTTALMVVNELGAVGRAVARKGRRGRGWWAWRRQGVTVLQMGFGLVPFLEEAFGEIPLAAASQPRVLMRVLEVLSQVASVEPDESLRVALVECGKAVFEAGQLGQLREWDRSRLEERWNELQREAREPGALPSAPIH